MAYKSQGGETHRVRGYVDAEGTKGVESIVKVAFEARGKETEVTLRRSNVPGDEMGRQTEWGWAHILDSVAEILSKKPGAA